MSRQLSAVHLTDSQTTPPYGHPSLSK